jgi:hypothetical protein
MRKNLYKIFVCVSIFSEMTISRIAFSHSVAMGPIKLTLSDLGSLREALRIAKELCHHYRTTEEGLAVFPTIPPT